MPWRMLIRTVLLLAVAGAALSQDSTRRSEASSAPFAEFRFMRLAYNDFAGGFGGRQRWLTDWPEAETHLLGGVRRLTRIDAAEEG